eukprot:908988-Pleurochrysis_carterae.AAC.1
MDKLNKKALADSVRLCCVQDKSASLCESNLEAAARSRFGSGHERARERKRTSEPMFGRQE